MAETIILDPTEVSTGRTQVDITGLVKAEGVDWGDAAIEAFMADRERGSAPVDFRIPNRQVVLPLNVKALGSTSFVTFRQNLQRKASLFQREGGWIRRTTASGTLFADVVNATLHLGGTWMQATRSVDIEAELRLELIPDWYGPEIVLPDRVETTNTELIWTETNILGDYPGRLRLVVDDDQGQAQMGLLYGIRSRNYSNASTAALKYEAETCTPMDSATVSGANIQHINLSTSWTPVMSTTQTGNLALTHVGTYRVWARVQALSGAQPAGTTSVEMRLLWDVGDFALPTENDPVAVPIIATFNGVDLGEVRLDRVPSGTHRWQGVIQARGLLGGEFVFVDKIWLVPVDEGYGVLRARRTSEPGLSSYIARDEFNQTSGVLATKPLPFGGTWQGIAGGAGFTVDFNVHQATRTATSDPSATPRLESAGTSTPANVAVEAALRHSVEGGLTGAFCRLVNDQNYLVARALSLVSSTPQTILQVAIVVAGTSTTLLSKTFYTSMVTAPVTVRLVADAQGRWVVYMGTGPQSLVEQGSGMHTALATGGALASGRVGLYDRYSVAAPPLTRYVDNFAAWAPPLDAVLHPNQSAELRTEGMFREEATGAAFGPVSHVVGDLPRIPPSGAEGRTVQFFVKASRGDLATFPDTDADDISARVSYRPSYLLTS